MAKTKKSKKSNTAEETFIGSGDMNIGTTYMTNPNDRRLKRAINNSMRLFGVPHQFTEINDPRIPLGDDEGNVSGLGRCFAEHILLEAPIVCFQPGVPDFLPGMSDADKKSFFGAIVDAANDSGNDAVKKVFQNLSANKSDDVLKYYQHKGQYNEYMAKVNVLCKLMAVFLGISDKKVPWAGGLATFGTYDWRYYTLKDQFDDVNFKLKSNVKQSNGVFIKFKDAFSNAAKEIMNDTKWVRFYVDSSSSYSESNSNSTTQSILESYTEKLEGIAKELDVISGISGVDMKDLGESVGSSVDNFIQSHANGNGPIATMLSRISGATKQILAGGNFLIPEIWSQSEYSKNYNFSITLSTPYGCTESWYLNIGVPLMHILGMALPQQLSANTYKSPHLVKCFSPGWFNCDLGIIDSIIIDKGADSSWNVGGLPNEVKVSLSVRDLYSTLSIPYEPYSKPEVFLSSGMLEYLMVNCGVDITQQDIGNRIKIWATIVGNNFTDRFTAIPKEIQDKFKSQFQHMFNILG